MNFMNIVHMYNVLAAHLATLVLNWKEDGAVFEGRKQKAKSVSQSLNPMIRYQQVGEL